MVPELGPPHPSMAQPDTWMWVVGKCSYINYTLTPRAKAEKARCSGLEGAEAPPAHPERKELPPVPWAESSWPEVGVRSEARTGCQESGLPKGRGFQAVSGWELTSCVQALHSP